MSEPTYTLPGVINYLTSEFTKLEQFKIVNNLERSEMKFKIKELEGEIKSLTFTNKLQKKTIERLQTENKKLRSRLNEEEVEEVIMTPSPEELAKMSKIDLQTIKRTRERLANSMKEIVTLLKPPTLEPKSLLDKPEINKADDFNFNVKPYSFESKDYESPVRNPSSLISQYFNSNTDLKEISKEKKKAEMENDSIVDDDEILDAELEDVLEKAISETSDSATIVLNDDDDPLADLNDDDFSLDDSPQERSQINNNNNNNNDDDDLDFEDKLSSFPSLVSPLSISSSSKKNKEEEGGYDHLDVYYHDPNTIYLRSMKDTTKKEVKLDMLLDGKLASTQKFEMETSAQDIADILPIDVPDTLLIVKKNGDVKSMVFELGNGKEHTIMSVKSDFKDIESCGLTEFTVKMDDTYKYYGLCISGKSSSNRKFLSKIYELSYDLSNRAVTSKEIGSYNKKFLTKGKPADEVHFAGWINNAKVDSLVDILEADKDPKSSISGDDLTLLPYEVLYDVDGKTIKLNIVSKQVLEILA
ncbi:Striatin family protein [Candida albicans]|uniref:Striatin family protein n=1 Tax=Candida albicans TaxID=5476 RepID=A0A8H6BWF0_CANAX|nr:Striatin family protein [Candida albicans]